MMRIAFALDYTSQSIKVLFKGFELNCKNRYVNDIYDNCSNFVKYVKRKSIFSFAGFPHH